MISELISYGGVIYWLLLFLGISLTTLFALKETDTLRPTFWAGLTLTFCIGFTSYEPNLIELFMGFISYLLVGLGYAAYRWARLVYNIRRFVHSLGLVETDDQTCKLVYGAFLPSDADGCVHLPPDPVDFRTRLLLWILYWPCFTIFAFVDTLHRKVTLSIWKFFLKMSRRIYACGD